MGTLKNRGKESDDDKLFGAVNMRHKLSEALADLRYFLDRGYTLKSAIPFVGNRYRLNVRQQKALQGMGASAEQAKSRRSKSVSFAQLENQTISIDGFNVLILLESLLSGAYIFKGSDGFYRDLSSVYGTYKKVEQTNRAIELVTEFFISSKISKITWYFDKPVSNSGRLKKLISDFAIERSLNWEVILTFSPDKDLAQSSDIIISSDAWILDHASKNFNFIAYIVEQQNVNINLFDGAQGLAIVESETKTNNS